MEDVGLVFQGALLQSSRLSARFDSVAGRLELLILQRQHKLESFRKALKAQLACE